VLAIEDQLPLVRTIRQAVASEGFLADVCHDSEGAQVLVMTRPYDLILLSLQLPSNQGFTLLRNLRRSGVSAPILVTIDSGSVVERVRCLDLGADGYMARPIDAMELAARIRAMVRRSSQNYENTIRVHDLEIDIVSRLVRRAGHAIRLTRREYALLQFLARHRGKVCSRAMIWQHLYDDQTVCKSNVVDVFIRFLRAKIDRDFSLPLILTRWGEGYLLRDEMALTMGEPEAS
jgi:DNA-binding response OmpR family regulator